MSNQNEKERYFALLGTQEKGWTISFGRACESIIFFFYVCLAQYLLIQKVCQTNIDKILFLLNILIKQDRFYQQINLNCLNEYEITDILNRTH